MIPVLAIDLSALTIGQVFGAFTIVIAVIFAVYETTTKLYGLFMKAHNAKSLEEDFKSTVKQHTDDIKNINDKIDNLVLLLEKQEIQNQKVDCALLRDRIIQSYKFHKDKGNISALDYENLNEMFSQYFARGGNHLITKLYEDFRIWKISLDEEK